MSDRVDAQRVQLGCRHVPHAPEPLDRQRVKEFQLRLGGDDEQSVRLGDAARDLREELRPRDPHRDRQPDALAHVASQTRCDLARRAGDPLEPAHVEECLVDRHPLDERRRVVEDAEHRGARLGVRSKARLDDNGPRTEAARPGLAHRGAHAGRLRLVARREDDPAADDQRHAAKAWIIALLDRREERIEVRVQDRRLA